MPVVLKHTAFFGSDGGRGWSESHALLLEDAPTDLLPYMLAFKVLMDDKRRPLLGKDCRLEGLRVAYESAAGSIASSAYKYAPFLSSGNQREGAAPSLSAKARFGDVSNTAFSDVHLRGFWDVIEENEQLNLTSGPGAIWKGLFDQYAAALVAGGYGWEGLDDATTRRGNVVGYTANVDKTITFNLEITEGPAITEPAGTKLRIKCSRLNNSNSALNRDFTVTVVDETNVKTVRQVAALPFLNAGTFIMEQKTFRTYTGVQYVILGKRSMGRPIGRSPARRKALPLG